MSGQWDRELEVAIEAAKRAGAAIKEVYDSSAQLNIQMKADDSPVTNADLASDAIIKQTISGAFPYDAIMTEETADDPSRLSVRRVWIVDPLDGTQQFLDRTGDFDVFIALTVDHRPVVAAICQPTTGIVLSAIAGQGAWIEDEHGHRPLKAESDPSAPVLVSTNRYHTPPSKWPRFIDAVSRAGYEPVEQPGAFFPRAFFDLPSGLARYNAYVGIGPGPDDVASGGEWDIAAPDLVLTEAGLTFTNDRGQPFLFNQPNRELRSGVVVAVDPAVHKRLVDALHAK